MARPDMGWSIADRDYHAAFACTVVVNGACIGLGATLLGGPNLGGDAICRRKLASWSWGCTPRGLLGASVKATPQFGAIVRHWRLE